MPLVVMKKCSVDCCEGAVRVKGFCQPHYDRFRRGLPLTAEWLGTPRNCSVATCDLRAVSQGYCNNHYRKFLKYGDPLVKKKKGPAPKTRKKCNLCDAVVLSKGLCNLHYTRLRKGTAMDAPRKTKYTEDAKCPCGGKPRIRGYCQRCHDAIYSDERRERMRRHYRENKAYYKAKKQRREYKQKLSTPKWLTDTQLADMNKIYRECKDGYEVDHIIPLNSDLVSGLHVPWNLQYLTAAENRVKRNKLCQT